MPRRIVILSAFVTPFRSGAEACVEEVSSRLQDDFDIAIVTARLRRDLPYLDHLSSGVKVWRVGFGYTFDKWLFPFLAPFAVRALKPDLIHAVLESYAGLAMMISKRLLPHIQHILTCQSTNTTFLVRAMHKSADVVTVISSVLLERAAQCKKEVVLIPNGISLDRINHALLHRPKIDGRILFVGRLEKMKGVDTLLTAFAKLREREDTSHENEKIRGTSDERDNSKLETIHLRIVGDGSQRKHLEQLAHDLKITDRVTFVGRVSSEKVADEFAQASIFCGLSRSEALGNVFLEAQAAGCGVIATNIGGIPDIVKNGETGMLISPDDVDAAVDAIQRLLSDDVLRQTLAQNGQKNAQNYDWQEIAMKYKEIYNKNLHI